MVQYIEIQFLLVPAVLPEALNQVRTVSVSPYECTYVHIEDCSMCDSTILGLYGDIFSTREVNISNSRHQRSEWSLPKIITLSNYSVINSYFHVTRQVNFRFYQYKLSYESKI